jgi:hypothetical protein
MSIDENHGRGQSKKISELDTAVSVEKMRSSISCCGKILHNRAGIFSQVLSCVGVISPLTEF